MGLGGSSDQTKLVVAGLQHALAAWDALQNHLSGSSAPLPAPGFEDATWSAVWLAGVLFRVVPAFSAWWAGCCWLRGP